MNEIKKERLAVLEETARRMREDDYNELPFASTDAMVRLLKTEAEWRKDLKPTRILNLIEDVAERERAETINNMIESDNKRIKDTYLKPLEFKIKVLELEMILFNGLFEMSEMAKEIHERVYPKEREEDER